MLRYSALPREARDSFLFRGQRDRDWKLQSTLDRQFAALSPSERQMKLDRLLNEFADELYGLEAASVIADSERLELLGRHHGLPTTVLDWSRSPYVAAYFAFEGAVPPPTGEVAVWVFDRRQLSKASVAGKVLINDMALIGDNVRALQQRGVFLRLPVGTDGEIALADGLAKYTVPYSERPLALRELDAMLITAKSLFRDRDAAARTAIIRESLP
ncbi:MAG: hypothetical protein JWO31_3968 [Phycisphaerales bacterium]|nr:hypothetical protein [Phycisphaerales bacterium]